MTPSIESVRSWRFNRKRFMTGIGLLELGSVSCDAVLFFAD